MQVLPDVETTSGTKHRSSQKQKANKPVLFGFWLKMSIPRSKQGEDE
jgi:hypothetical protein